MSKPAFRLRRATTDDFQTFYNFYVHDCYHWLYHDEIATEEDNPFDVTFEDTDLYSKEDWEYLYSQIIDFNAQDFEDYLRWYKIFFIIVDKKVIGYVKFENYCKQFIIRNWTMHYDYIDETLLNSLLEKFETYAPKKAKKIQVISPGLTLSRGFLEKHGYHAECIPFFNKSCEKKPE